jgi:hypothetical protein
MVRRRTARRIGPDENSLRKRMRPLSEQSSPGAFIGHFLQQATEQDCTRPMPKSRNRHGESCQLSRQLDQALSSLRPAVSLVRAWLDRCDVGGAAELNVSSCTWNVLDFLSSGAESLKVPNLQHIGSVIHGSETNLVTRNVQSDSKRCALARIDRELRNELPCPREFH